MMQDTRLMGIVTGLIPLVVGLLVIGGEILKRKRHSLKVPGTIISAAPKTVRDSKGRQHLRFSPTIEYEVKGAVYTTRWHARSGLAARPGKKVTVIVNPNDYADAAEAQLGAIIVGLIAVAFGVYIIIVGGM